MEDLLTGDAPTELEAAATSAEETAPVAETPTEAAPAEKPDVAEAALAAPQRVALDAESLAALAQVVQKPVEQPQAAEPPLTPEQIRQLLNVYEATAEDVAALGLPETAMPKLNAILGAIVKQAVTTASVHTEAVRRQIEQALTPLREMHRERQLENLRQEFYTVHKDLQGKDKLVDMVYARLVQSGTWQPKTKAEAFKTVADQTRQLINEYLAAGGGQETKSLPARAGAQPRKMPTVLAGGQAGSAAAGAKTTQAKERDFTKWLLDMQ